MFFSSHLRRSAGLALLITTALALVTAGQTNISQSSVGHIVDKVRAKDLSTDDPGIPEYEKLIQTTPDDMAAVNNLGALYYKFGRYEDGLRYMKQAADTAPQIWNFQLNTSIALEKQGQFNAALEYALRAKRAAPDKLTVREQLCSMYLATGKPDALPCYENLTTDARADPADMLGYAEALIRVKDYKAAEEVISRTITVAPNMPQAHNDLGVVAFKQKRYLDAVNSLRQAVSLDPGNSQIRFNLALADMAARNRDGAISQYKMLKTSDPQMADRLYRLMFAGQVVNAGH